MNRYIFVSLFYCLTACADPSWTTITYSADSSGSQSSGAGIPAPQPGSPSFGGYGPGELGPQNYPQGQPIKIGYGNFSPEVQAKAKILEAEVGAQVMTPEMTRRLEDLKAQEALSRAPQTTYRPMSPPIFKRRPRVNTTSEPMAPGQRHRTPSPTLEPSYPELVLLGTFRGTAAAVRETIELARRIHQWSEMIDNYANREMIVTDHDLPIGPEERYRFYRLGNDRTQTLDHAELISRTEQLHGSNPAGTFDPEVQGYYGELPANSAPGSMQLETPVRPSSIAGQGQGPEGAMVRWDSTSEGVFDIPGIGKTPDRVGIPVKVIEVVR